MPHNIRVHTCTKRTSTLTYSDDDNDYEIELDFADVDEDSVLVHRQDDHLIVGYLVHDSDAGDSPLEEGTANGNLYTRTQYRRGLITDNDSEFRYALGLDSNEEPDIDRNFDLPEPIVNWRGETVRRGCLWDLAAVQFFEKFKQDDDLKEQWIRADLDRDLDEGELYDIDLEAVRRDLFDQNGVFWSEVRDLAMDLYKVHWRRIAGPGVVVVGYHDERGETSVSPTSWDGDWQDTLPDGVWVADKDVDENIEGSVLPANVTLEQDLGDDYDRNMVTAYVLRENGVPVFTGTFGSCRQYAAAHYVTSFEDTIRAYEKYAEGVLKEYSSWASGDVWGVVIETFNLEDGEWVSDEVDSVWRFIGHEWAEDALRQEYFDPAVKRAQEALA